MADACMRRLRCLPAVGRASQVAPLRVGVVWWCVGFGVVVIIRHVRRGDIHVARMAAAKCRPRGVWRVIKWGKRRGDIHVARMTDACMRLCCLPAVGRASQVAPLRVGGLCGGGLAAVRVAVAVRASQVAPLRVGGLGGGSGGVVCVVCGQSWLRLIFPLMRKRATMWALGMTMSPA